jgi:hypothetical protein
MDSQIVLRDENPIRQVALRHYPPADPTRRANPPAVDEAADGYLKLIAHDVFLCYRLGLDHAAIVTACTLVEMAIKTAVVFFIALDKGLKPNHQDWLPTDRKTLDPLARYARTILKGVPKDFWESVDEFKREYRDVYLHGAVSESLLRRRVTVDTIDINTGVISKQEVTLRDSISLQRQFRPHHDRDVVDAVVEFAIFVVNSMTAQMQIRFATWHAAERNAGRTADPRRVNEALASYLKLFPGATFTFPKSPQGPL